MMKTLTNRGIVIAIGLALAGCAGTTGTYRSIPTGATVTEIGSGANFGMAPTTVTYQWTKEHEDKNGCLIVKGVTFTWLSGAQISTAPTQPLCNGQREYGMTATRPAGEPGYASDQLYAMEAMKIQIMQQQVAAQRRAAMAQGFLAIQGMSPKATRGSVTGPGMETWNYNEITR